MEWAQKLLGGDRQDTEHHLGVDLGGATHAHMTAKGLAVGSLSRMVLGRLAPPVSVMVDFSPWLAPIERTLTRVPGISRMKKKSILS